jgi:hypothetical protein
MHDCEGLRPPAKDKDRKHGTKACGESLSKTTGESLSQTAGESMSQTARRRLEPDRRRKHEPDRPSGAACPGKEAPRKETADRQKTEKETNVTNDHIRHLETDVAAYTGCSKYAQERADELEEDFEGADAVHQLYTEEVPREDAIPVARNTE